MKNVLIFLIIMFSFFKNASAEYNQLAYNFKFKSIDGKLIDLSNFKDNVILVVNVASRCGFTNQYNDLQDIWNSHQDKGLVVLGVPTNDFKQEPGSNKDIQDFCETNFDINFPMTEKTHVIGTNSHPFYQWAKENYGKSAVPKWNFHKIIIGKDGKVADTFSSITNPNSKRFLSKINELIKN